MTSSTSPLTPGVAPMTGPLYRHVVATTLLQSLVVVGALAVNDMAPWAAALVLAAALAQAAHAAHHHRSFDPHGRSTGLGPVSRDPPDGQGSSGASGSSSSGSSTSGGSTSCTMCLPVFAARRKSPTVGNCGTNPPGA